MPASASSASSPGVALPLHLGRQCRAVVCAYRQRAERPLPVTAPFSLPFWSDPTPMVVRGTGMALPGEPISSEQLLTAVERRFGLSLGRRGMAIAHKLGIRTRHLCREMAFRLEAPRKGHRNPELAAISLRGALGEAGLMAHELSYLIFGHTATPARLMPPNVGSVAEVLDYGGPFVEFRQACTGFANALVFAQGLLRAGAGPIAIVGSETGSVFFDPVRAAEDAGQLVNLVQMGDGAAAIILARHDDRAGPRLSHVYYGQMGRGRAPGLAVADGGSDAPSCSAGFPEFQHDFAAIHRSGLELLLHCAAAAKRTGSWPADHVLPHQVNGRMDTILAGPLGLARERIVVTADRLGNTGSAAIWLALAQMRPNSQTRRHCARPRGRGDRLHVRRVSVSPCVIIPACARCSAPHRVAAERPLVAIENISKRYGRTTAVAGVTLSLRAGGDLWFCRRKRRR